MFTHVKYRKYIIYIASFMCFIPFRVSALQVSVTKGNLANTVIAMARSENISIVGADTLQGDITAFFEAKDAKSAIYELGKIRHFKVKEIGSTLVVEGSSNTESDDVWIYKPTHITPLKLKEALSTVVDREKIKVISESNQIVVVSSTKELEHAREITQQVDIMPTQVSLEVTVVAMEHSLVKERGLNWSWLGIGTHSLDKSGDYGGIRFGKALDGNPYTFFAKANLSALDSNSRMALVARPSIVALNGEEAKILIGDRVPVLVETEKNGNTATTVKYEETGIRLSYVPHITEDKGIDIQVHAEISTPSLVSELKAYRITTREASTRVRLRNNETLIIGGLMDSRTQKQLQKIPLLGDIPLLGKLFRHAREVKDNVELFILVKVHIIDEGNE